ncbi:MAG: helix-turn-helix transcriptional regulator [Lachnospiraceae bacterium]|nr:helix-turn-helix transcriptional regulator [Lachnospiraceae bacterium]
MTKLFSNLKILCEKRKLSIAALEKELGFSTASLAKWKDSSPRIDKVQKVAEYFDISIDYLVNGSLSEQYSLDESFANSLLQKTLSKKLLWSNIKDSNIEYIITQYQFGQDDKFDNPAPSRYEFQQAFYFKSENYYVISLLYAGYTKDDNPPYKNHYRICLLNDTTKEITINSPSNIEQKLYETIYSILYEEPKKQASNQFMTDFITQIL